MRLEIKMTRGKNVWRAKHDNGQIHFVVTVASRKRSQCRHSCNAASSNHIRYDAVVHTDVGEATWNIVKKCESQVRFGLSSVEMYRTLIYCYSASLLS